jgi:hypothetical protein
MHLILALIIAWFSLWMCYAIRHQIKLYGWSMWRVLVVAAVNFFACPVCMVIAIFKGE